MAEDRMRAWETLFRRASSLIDSAGQSFERWSFGGGTVLMRRHLHRLSKDIDIFVPDPQYLGYVSPRLNDVAAKMTSDYIEQGLSLKLVFPEGEIDFIASEPLTQVPTITEEIFGRSVAVETSTEIIAKKVWYRAEQFKARDILDLALVAEKEPAALREIAPILSERKKAILNRIAVADTQLRADFEQLEILTYRRTYSESVEIAKRALDDADALMARDF